MNRLRLLLIVLLFSFSCQVGQANVGTPAAKLCAPIFNDHAVFQQGEAIPVWGSAPAGALISVEFNDATVTTRAAPDGSWQLELPPMPADKLDHLDQFPEGRTLTVTSDKGPARKQIFHNILIGEVWLCSGQSNMAGKVRNNRKKQNPDDDLTQLQMPALRQYRSDTGWISATPEEVREFSRVGVTFGRKLQQELNVPVGLLFGAVGGTKIETWIRPDAGVDTSAKHAPGSNYRKHIDPIAGYGLKGILWYQGEGNASDGFAYFDKLKSLIDGWRTVWSNQALPFLIVQLAGIGQSDAEQPAMGDGRAAIREAQFQAMKQFQNVGLATAIDIGGPGEHPPNKTDIGIRLAHWALHHNYARETIAASGPIFKGFERKDSAMVIHFENAEGLMLGRKDTYDPVQAVPEGTPLPWLSIQDQKGNWHWAESRILGETLVVQHPDVSNPKAVRYAWTNNPNHPVGPYLYNQYGLPAFPFTTESWSSLLD
ncbi:sialate O-acetylesterase [Coraliomargarita sinensis]|nr:sialate O-acetylesterase [Coraliomargarita sinensis]